jgi:hypothetical protein
VPGIKAGSWASNRGQMKFTALALDTMGKPIKGQSLEVRGRLTQIISTRKRMVGGFYAYDNRAEVRDLGTLCSGSTDDRGLLLCDASLTTAGQVELIAQGKDSAGNVAQAATSVWVTKQGELWFAQDNDDRIDVLPEKKRYDRAKRHGCKCACRSPKRPRCWRWARGVIETRVVSCAETTRRSSSRSTTPGAPTSTSASSRCADAFATCPGIRFSRGAGKSRSPGCAASGTKDASTRRRRRWSTWPSLRSSSASRPASGPGRHISE